MKRLGNSLALLAFLASCGSDEAGSYYTAASGTISEATATSLASTMTNAVKLSFTQPAELPSGFTRDTFDSCTTQDPATTEDADSDLIAKTKKKTYACTDVPHGTIVMDQNGSYTVTDKDDTSATSGYRYEYDITGGHSPARSGARGDSETYSYKGFFDLTKGADGGYAYTSNFQGFGENVSTERAAYTNKYTYGSTWSHTMTPTDAADPTAGGTVTMGGFWGYKVEVTGTDPGGATNYDFVSKVTSEGLTYGGTGCSNFFSAGSITFEDAAANKVVFTYTCSAVTRTYNGTSY